MSCCSLTFVFFERKSVCIFHDPGEQLLVLFTHKSRINSVSAQWRVQYVRVGMCQGTRGEIMSFIFTATRDASMKRQKYVDT